jgi:YHS domain-containing protein
MMRKFWWSAVGVLALAGCSGDQGGGAAPEPAAPPPSATQSGPAATTPETPKTDEGPKAEPPKTDDAKGEAPKGAAASVNLSEEEIAEIKKLPEADQALALAQKVCPVSDDHLGAMEKPFKMTVDGKTFFLCCAGCKKEVDKDPAKIIAKLNK